MNVFVTAIEQKLLDFNAYLSNNICFYSTITYQKY